MQLGFKWVFLPLGASHVIGVRERLVKTLKRSLKTILGKELIIEEVIQTVFTEAKLIAKLKSLR